MKRSERLGRIAALRRREEDKAARALTVARGQQTSRQKTLDELMAYRREYEALMASRTASGLGVSELLNLRGFLDTLDRAVQQQRRAVGSSGESVEVSRRAWQEARSAAEALSRVTDRVAGEESFEAAQKEQQQLLERLLAGAAGQGREAL